MSEVRTVFTYDDYLQLPDEERYEVLEGVLIKEPSPVPYHQGVSGNIFMVLRGFVEERRLGLVLGAPVDVVLSPVNVVQPDVIYISRERLACVTGRNITGAPDLAVEVLSPSTGRKDRVIKARVYAQSGVREYWVVDPEYRTVEVLIASAGGFQTARMCGPGEDVTSTVLSGLVVPVDKIFHWPL